MNQSKSVGVACSLRYRTSGTRMERGANRLRQHPGTERLHATLAVPFLSKTEPASGATFSTPRSTPSITSKRTDPGLGARVSICPHQSRNPSSPVGRPPGANWEIWEFPKTRSWKFGKFPRTATQSFAGFFVHTPVNFLRSQG